MLKLGIETDNEESYTAQGSSIKKTQHAAAELALKQTKFKIPIKRAIKTSSNNEESPLSSSTPNENQTDSSKTKENNEKNLQANIKIKNNSKINRKNFSKKSIIIIIKCVFICKAPTVRLNTLAMKLGLVANYSHTVISYPNSINYNLDLSQQKQQNLFDYNTYTSFMNNQFNSTSNQQMHTPHQSYQIAQQIQRPKQFIKVKLTFAEKEFNGQGIILQTAKHDAASKALDYFSDPDKFLEAKSLSNSSQNTTVKAYRPPGFYKQQQQESIKTETEKISNEEETKPKNILNSEIKSEIQLVYEYAYYLKKSVDFELVQESGPSHIKKFVTKCIIGNRDTDKTSELLISSNESNSFPLKTIGEGNSKKQSKKESAIKMLVILKEKFEPLLLISSNNRLVQLNETNTESESNKTIFSSELTNKKHRKNKAKNIIKNKKTSPEYGKGSINPISRLMQIQQAKREREPLFELLPQSKRRQQEFTIQVTIELATTTTATSSGVATPSNNILKCEGKGSTKKIAKQKAAEAMLIKLGYLSRQPTQSVLKPSLKLTSQNSSEEISDVQEELNNKPSDDLTLKAQVINESENQVETKSNEKKVKFLEDPNLVKSENNTAGKLKPIQMNPENKG
jgi:dsRNA-specific ribonuclease